MSAASKLRDGLVNLVSSLGTARDKASHSQYATPCMDEQELVNAYRGSWLPRKIVDIPALDSFRKWRAWMAEAKQISALEQEETRLGVQGKLLEAQIKARLFGGAAVYIGTGSSNPALPLVAEGVQAGGIRHLAVVTKRVLIPGDIEDDVESPNFGRPAFYTLSSKNSGVVKIHPSRLVIMRGAKLPDQDISGDRYGWDDSVLTAVLEEIKRADGTSANIASLVFEAKVDVLKLPNFMAQMSDPAYEQQVLTRLQLAAMAKGINGMLVLDSEEDYQQKSAQFTSLRDILMAFFQLVSGAADIPITRLLGQSPAGLNATGDNDVRNYYDRIQSIQELEIGPAMTVFDECLIRSALGSRPAEVFYNWRSLWQSTDEEKAKNGKTTAESIKIIADTKLIPDEVMSMVAVNMLTESGIAPGLEGEMADWLAENPDGLVPNPDEEPVETDPAEPGPDQIVDATPRSMYVRRDVLNSDEIREWAESQGIVDILDDLHVTIAYSKTPIDWIKVGNNDEYSEGGRGTLTIPAGGPRAVEPLGNMAAVILFASSRLSWRHKEILSAGASHDWPDYQPHISLTKLPVSLGGVQPYRGRIVLGPEIFEEVRSD